MAAADGGIGEACGSVLVVDDEGNVREFVRQALEALGFEVVAVPSGHEALACVRERRFDIVLMDLMMPGMSGVQTLVALREASPELQVVVATGVPSLETAVECLRLGAFDYLEKPLSVTALRRALEGAVATSLREGAHSLGEIAQDFLGVLDEDHIVELVTRSASRVVRADEVALVLVRPGGSRSVVGSVPEAVLLEADLCLRIAAAAMPDGEPPGGAAPGPAVGPPRWPVLALPLVSHATTIGVLLVARTDDRAAFTAAEERRARLFAAHAALAFDNARLYGDASRRVAELSAAHERAVEAEARARVVLDSAHDAILTMDGTGSIEDSNPMAERMFGYTRRELHGRSLPELVAGEADRRKLEGSLRELRECRAGSVLARPLETAARRRAGEPFPAEIRIAAAAASGRVLVSAFVRDMTERKRLEVELQHAQKLESVGRLAAGIAHEINTPIQFVGDNTHFVRDAFGEIASLLARYRARPEARAAGPAEVEELRRAEAEADVDYLLEEIPKALDQTLEGVERVATIVRAMKDFAHPDTREKVAQDLNKCLQSTLCVARNELKYVAEVETDFAELPSVLCHPGDLNQVFLNLLVNAAHAVGDVVKGTGTKGTIRVTTRAEGGTVVVAIQDTGSGIPESIRGKVFDPFFTTKGVGKGTGQGLALARSIVVDKHHGSVSFETEAGRGTTFYLRLPVDGCPPGEAAREAGSRPEPAEVLQ